MRGITSVKLAFEEQLYEFEMKTNIIGNKFLIFNLPTMGSGERQSSALGDVVVKFYKIKLP